MLALTTRSVIDFWPQEEPSRAYTQGTQWPRYGGCVVARARTHARSWRRKTGQPECDLGPHSQAIKGPHECYCALLSKSPTIYKRLANTHKKYSGEKVAAVTAAATVLCAKQQHNHCAAPDFPGFVQTVRFAQKTFIFFTSFRLSSSGKPRTRAQSSRRSHGTICIVPHYPRKSPFTRLYCQPKKRHCFEQQKSSLTWSKKRPSIKCTFHAVKERPLVTIAAWQGSAA